MAKCAVCGKSVHFGNNVSHSHRRIKCGSQTLSQSELKLMAAQRRCRYVQDVYVLELLSVRKCISDINGDRTNRSLFFFYFIYGKNF